MLNANQLNALKAFAFEQRPLVAITASGVSGAGSFELGQKLQASVQAQVSPGMFRVRIGDQVVQMQLPAPIKSGDTVTLQVAATQPRLVFSMSASTNPLSTPEELSATSRLLSALSQQQPEKALVRPAQKAPLWPVPQAPESKQLAGILREALSYSGLFYESHQAQWLQGSRTTVQLLQEPQNHPPAGQVAAAVKGREEDTPGGGLPQSSLSQQNGKTAEMPEHLQPLVQQQLNALETRQMVWQGQVWPGQVMQWEIHEHGQPATQEDTGYLRQWTTVISLNLPNLGEVNAKLHFGDGGLSLVLDAGSTTTRSALSGAAAQLAESMAGNGIPVINMRVVAA
jgi:hypothetical protein